MYHFTDEKTEATKVKGHPPRDSRLPGSPHPITPVCPAVPPSECPLLPSLQESLQWRTETSNAKHPEAPVVSCAKPREPHVQVPGPETVSPSMAQGTLQMME